MVLLVYGLDNWPQCGLLGTLLLILWTRPQFDLLGTVLLVYGKGSAMDG